ncbi:MAG: hypothetical protein CL946_07240 [Ectothiorhodospiraceae bacterium]|nr:hypothetical protein [Ectothiorhodospiraceae bacterium]
MGSISKNWFLLALLATLARFSVQAAPAVNGPETDPYFSARWFGTVTAYKTAVPRHDDFPPPFEGYDPNETNIKIDHALIVGGIMVGTLTAVHIYQRNAWWSGDRVPFHVQDDPEYALNVDKAGHFYGGAITSYLSQRMFQWAGMSVESSVWGGFAFGSIFELYVEVEDGFAPDWGFSPSDAIADVVGAAWPVGQYYVPALQHFQPKFSYYPSDRAQAGKHEGNAIDDYGGQTYWMGIHVDKLLPSDIEPYWPDWLGIAVGISVRDYITDDHGIDQENIHSNVILALDYDMEEILPGDSWFMKALKQGLNYIHFPSPAIRISPSFIAYGLYFY